MLYQDLAARIVPPRHGEVLVITLDTTDRPYDISGLAMGGRTPGASGTQHEVFLTIQADGADVYFALSNETESDLDETSAVAAGGTAAYADAYCAHIPDGQERTYCIDRRVDKFLLLKGSAAGYARIFASSRST